MSTFSVIIATRNRPSSFASALRSVLRQTCKSVEVVVVDDGSDEQHLAEYHRTLNCENRAIDFLSLRRRRVGHGPSYARNAGVDVAKGEYLCFLDDDDLWTDDDYLTRVQATFEQAGTLVDVHISNQVAFNGDQKLRELIWLEDLAVGLSRSGRDVDKQGAYLVSADDVLKSERFCHLNTLIIRRDYFAAIGGFDEAIRWEEDRDLFWRAIDRACKIYYSPHVVSRHNVPNVGLSCSASTADGEIERRLYQARVFDKAALFGVNPRMRRYGRLHKGYALRHIAQKCAENGDYSNARFFARQALGAWPTFKSAINTVFLKVARK